MSGSQMTHSHYLQQVDNGDIFDIFGRGNVSAIYLMSPYPSFHINVQYSDCNSVALCNSITEVHNYDGSLYQSVML